MTIPKWIVREVEPRSDYSLLLTFANGEKKVYDATHLLSKPIYAPLKTQAFFLKAKAMCGTVVWSDEIDIAPEHLFDASKPYSL